jgi:hypothetical protein
MFKQDASFAAAVNGGRVRTTNDMAAHASSGAVLTDLFFSIGASRNNIPGAIAQFAKAFNADRLLATKILFWARDVRGGAGEREVFRKLLNQLETFAPEVALRNLHLVPVYGRWDDLLCLQTTAAKEVAYSLIADTLRGGKEGVGLCAKWMPRQGAQAVALRKFMNLSPKQWRKMVVGLSNTVEQKMCARQWDQINYNHLPSLAAKQYQKTFSKHDPVGYAAYRAALVKNDGSAKINASAIYPHDVIKGIQNGDAVVAQAQWDALPNYLDPTKFILPMVDVSGSMSCAAGNSTTRCIDVSLALGLYLATKQTGPFKNLFLNFSANAKLIELKSKTISGMMDEMNRSQWDMNTNVESAFNEILRVATSAGVSQEQMPQYILILSDMQFDACSGSNYNATMMEMARQKFERAGYKLPNIIFWNLNAHSNVPAKADELGTALISGFSPAIMKAVLAAKTVTPWDIMLTAIDSERYDAVSV